MIVCRYFRANYFHLGVLYKSHDLVYFVANPQKRLRCHTVWHPGNLLFSSLNVMFGKAPSWNAATMYYTGDADREWFARKRREIDEINKQIKSREIEMQLQVQEEKKQSLQRRMQMLREGYMEQQKQAKRAAKAPKKKPVAAVQQPPGPPPLPRERSLQRLMQPTRLQKWRQAQKAKDPHHRQNEHKKRARCTATRQTQNYKYYRIKKLKQIHNTDTMHLVQGTPCQPNSSALQAQVLCHI